MLNEKEMKVRKEDENLKGSKRLIAAWNWAVEILNETNWEEEEIERLVNAERYMKVLLEKGLKNKHMFQDRTPELTKKSIENGEKVVEQIQKMIEARREKSLLVIHLPILSMGILDKIHITAV